MRVITGQGGSQHLRLVYAFIGQNNDYPMYLNAFFINLSPCNKLIKK